MTIAYRNEEAGNSSFFYCSFYTLTYHVVALIIFTFLVFTTISSYLVVKGLWPGGFQLSSGIYMRETVVIFSDTLWSYFQSGIRARIRPFFSPL